MADEDLELDVGEDGAPKKSKKMLFIIIGVVLLVLIGAGAGAYFMGVFDSAPPEEEVAEEGTGDEGDDKGEEEAEELSDDAIYWPLEPPFVLNFEGKSKAKYMQVGLVTMARSQKSVDTLKKHMPAIRNELTFLLSSQKYVEMVTPEGKEQLRDEIMETINTVIKSHGAGAGLQKIYFTSFVMQ